MWYQATDDAENASRDAKAADVWVVIGEAVEDALLALLVGELITEEQFNTLYEPWASVMDVQMDEQLIGLADLTAARTAIEGGESIARLVSKLQDAAIDLFTEVEILRQKVATLESDLAKFHRCDDSDGCRDENDSVHVLDSSGARFAYNYNGEQIRTVYHKDAE
jgi:hypothetical protein